MDSEEDNVRNQASGTLTYMPWYEHVKNLLTAHWKTFLLYWLGGFGVFWGVVESASFFYPESKLNNPYILFGILFFCFLGSILRCIYDYRNMVPVGLENESAKIHKIAGSKRLFWEYALAYELLKSRFEKIDQELDDIMNNRVHVKVNRSMDVEGYIQWVQTRPENLLRIIATAKQLLIFDLIYAIHPKDGGEINFSRLIRVVDLINDLYKSAYEFEIEGREIKIPDMFDLVHEIQFEWIPVIRDAFYQMLSILNSAATREKDNLSPIEATITFEEPPRIDEFCEEIDRLRLLMEA
ncbi:MAG: hypothetical protein AB9Q22_03725 [Candidatus Reddybacter sp.]